MDGMAFACLAGGGAVSTRWHVGTATTTTTPTTTTALVRRGALPFVRGDSRTRACVRRDTVCMADAPDATPPPANPAAGVPELKQPPSRPSVSPSTTDDESSPSADTVPYDLGLCASASARPSSSIMQTMMDYFGDDGRQIDDYLKRPRNEAGQVMLRVLIIGSGPAEVATAKVLHESDRVTGLYYCPDTKAACELDMNPFAQSSTVGAEQGSAEILRFCKWALVDTVFVGPDHGESIDAAAEAALAEDGITLFDSDITAAVTDGSMTVSECFAPITEQIEAEEASDEQLVE